MSILLFGAPFGSFDWRYIGKCLSYYVPMYLKCFHEFLSFEFFACCFNTFFLDLVACFK